MSLGLFVFGWFLGLGYLPMNMDLVKDGVAGVQIETDNAFIQELGLDVVVDSRLRLWTEIETREFYGTGLSFNPFSAEYRLGAEILAGPARLGVKHACRHPVLSGGDLDGSYSYSSQSTQFYLSINGGYRR